MNHEPNATFWTGLSKKSFFGAAPALGWRGFIAVVCGQRVQRLRCRAPSIRGQLVWTWESFQSRGTRPQNGPGFGRPIAVSCRAGVGGAATVVDHACRDRPVGRRAAGVCVAEAAVPHRALGSDLGDLAENMPGDIPPGTQRARPTSLGGCAGPCTMSSTIFSKFILPFS